MNFSSISNRSFLGKLARLPLALIPGSAVVPIMQGPLKGKKWVVGSSIHGCWLGSYEHHMQIKISSMLKPADVFYDVGAHVGFYSLLASSIVGDSGKVFAFEPFPRNLGFLKRHLELNHVRNVNVFESAVGEVNGTCRFSTGIHDSEGRLSDQGDLVVTVNSLDSLADSIPPPTHIKMDIEGGELHALRGAVHLFQSAKPVLFLATHGADVRSACCQLLASWGYKLIPMSGATMDESDDLIATPVE